MTGVRRQGAVALLLCSGIANAKGTLTDPYSLPQGARPPTLPELTHPDLEVSAELASGFLVPKDGGAWRASFVQRIQGELPLGSRRWFLGGSFPWAFGAGEADAVRPLVGNLELGIRTVWATPTGLAAGAGMAAILPTGPSAGSANTDALALDSVAMRPWELPHFTPGVSGLRLFFDLRTLDGPFVLQFRQGLDILVGMSDAALRRATAILGVFVGFRFSQRVSGGIEAFELYLLDDPGKDHGRATFVLSPNIRLDLPYVQPTLTVFSSVGATYQDRASVAWGTRLALSFVYDVAPKR